jgi:hypothetical protein
MPRAEDWETEIEGDATVFGRHTQDSVVTEVKSHHRVLPMEIPTIICALKCGTARD